MHGQAGRKETGDKDNGEEIGDTGGSHQKKKEQVVIHTWDEKGRKIMERLYVRG
jgi:hypothetical protein